MLLTFCRVEAAAFSGVHFIDLEARARHTEAHGHGRVCLRVHVFYLYRESMDKVDN